MNSKALNTSPGYPSDRIRYMLDDAQPVLVLTCAQTAGTGGDVQQVAHAAGDGALAPGE